MNRLAEMLRDDTARHRGPRGFFLRDDDAVRPGPQLDRLIALSHRFDLPIALAVIPAAATEALADRLASEERVTVWQHGVDHRNRAAEGEKKCEFPACRDGSEARDALAWGRDRLGALFGARFAPVFVPPWNRFAPTLLPHLTELGFTVLSDFGKLTREVRAQGLASLPCQLDPVAWRTTRSAVEDAVLVDQLTGALATDGPVGLLTHHAVHDPALWSLVARIVEIFCENGANRHQPTVIPASSHAFFGSIRGEKG